MDQVSNSLLVCTAHMNFYLLNDHMFSNPRSGKVKMKLDKGTQDKKSNQEKQSKDDSSSEMLVLLPTSDTLPLAYTNT